MCVRKSSGGTPERLCETLPVCVCVCGERVELYAHTRAHRRKMLEERSFIDDGGNVLAHTHTCAHTASRKETKRTRMRCERKDDSDEFGVGGTGTGTE